MLNFRKTKTNQNAKLGTIKITVLFNLYTELERYKSTFAVFLA